MPARERDGIADLREVHVLHSRDEVADLSGPERVDRPGLGRHHTSFFSFGLYTARHHPDPRPRPKRAVAHPEIHDDAAVWIEHRIEDERAQRVGCAATWRRRPLDHHVEDLLHAFARLRRDAEDLLGRTPQ